MRKYIEASLAGLARLYLAGLFGWLAVRWLFGDQWRWLFLLNSLAEYLFAPLAGLLPIALLARRRDLWAGLGAGTAVWCALYGALWWPKLRPGPTGGPQITVMTFNMLGYSQEPAAVVAALRGCGADLIAIQELNPPAAAAIRAELAASYPHQALAEQAGAAGMGVISRYPLRPLDLALPDEWVGPPQALQVELGQHSVVLLNIHTSATHPIIAEATPRSIRARERQAAKIAELAAVYAGPLIVLGDFNTTDQSVAYATVARQLVDAWRAAGWGPGHTFPGANAKGRTQPRFGKYAVPRWLIRIDYIFHSRHWQALSARIGPWDGVSDHRPVIATLALKQPA